MFLERFLAGWSVGPGLFFSSRLQERRVDGRRRVGQTVVIQLVFVGGHLPALMTQGGDGFDAKGAVATEKGFLAILKLVQVHLIGCTRHLTDEHAAVVLGACRLQRPEIFQVSRRCGGGLHNNVEVRPFSRVTFRVGYLRIVEPYRHLVGVDELLDLIDQALAFECEGLQQFTRRDPFQHGCLLQFFVLHRHVYQEAVHAMAFGLPVRAKDLLHGP